jgi:hypothetical protein
LAANGPVPGLVEQRRSELDAVFDRLGGRLLPPS